MISDKRGALYREYQNDESKEKGGVWLDFGVVSEDDDKHCRFLVARAGGSNNSFTKLRERMMQPHRRAIKNETIPDSVINDITKEVLAKTIILNWENVYDEKSEKLAFNKKNVLKVLNDLPDLYLEILNYAMDRTVFKDSAATDTKNS